MSHIDGVCAVKSAKRQLWSVSRLAMIDGSKEARPASLQQNTVLSQQLKSRRRQWRVLWTVWLVQLLLKRMRIGTTTLVLATTHLSTLLIALYSLLLATAHCLSVGMCTVSVLPTSGHCSLLATSHYSLLLTTRYCSLLLAALFSSLLPTTWETM